jgi:WD40 repeat protein
MNHPLKKIGMKAILGDEINELIENKDFKTIEKIQADDKDIIDIETLPLMKTPKGVYTDSISQLSVSRCGERVWASYTPQPFKWKLLMQCFRTKKSLLYNFEHRDTVSAVIVSEDLGLAMTGGDDDIAVLYCLESGKTIKVFGTEVSCLLRVGSIVAVTDHDKEVRFFDLIKRKMLGVVPVEIGFDVLCMQLCIRKSFKNNQDSQLLLFLGGLESTEITEIILPEEIIKKSISHINSVIG